MLRENFAIQPVIERKLPASRPIAAPERWNGSVLIYCHGLRPEGGPLMVELLPLKSAYAELLDRGWIIAATSYRRNGLVVADGLADVLALRDEIAKRFGAPSRVVSGTGSRCISLTSRS